jgi:hypothetical protein
MDMHMSDFLPDPQDANAVVTSQAAWLIEKMLVRNRSDRYATWSEVIDDIDAVTHGGMPLPPLPEPGQSTVSRSANRKIVVPAAPEPQLRLVKRIEQPEVQKALSAEARAKVRQRLDAAEERRAQPNPWTKNLVLRISIAAAIAVAAYWLFTHYIAPKPQRDTGPIVPPELQGLMHKADGSESAGQAVNPGLQPQYRVARDSNELWAFQHKVSFSWTNEDYQTAASLYNTALLAFADHKSSRGNPANLKRIEFNLKTCVKYFQKCKDCAPAGYEIDKYIEECNKVLAEVQAAKAAP